MLLKILVLLGIAVYCAIQGEWWLVAFAVLAMIPRVGLLWAILLTVILAVKGWYLPAGILGGLIVYNLVGNLLVERLSQRSQPGDSE